MEFSTLEY